MTLPEELVQCGHRGKRIEASAQRLVCFGQLGSALLRGVLPLVCKGDLRFLRPLQLVTSMRVPINSSSPDALTKN